MKRDAESTRQDVRVMGYDGPDLDDAAFAQPAPSLPVLRIELLFVPALPESEDGAPGRCVELFNRHACTRRGSDDHFRVIRGSDVERQMCQAQERSRPECLVQNSSA